jgi:hypothetical protein
MSDSPRSTKSNALLGLLIITGLGLMLAAPVGLAGQLREGFEWRWWIIPGAELLIGSILFGLGGFLYRRRRRP